MKLVHWPLMGHGWTVTFDTAKRGLGGPDQAGRAGKWTGRTGPGRNVYRTVWSAISYQFIYRTQSTNSRGT